MKLEDLPWDDADDYDLNDDEPDDDPDEREFDCGYVPHTGTCTKAGSEECDWECPYAEEFGVV